MPKEPISAWDKMVVADLKQDLEAYERGELAAISAQAADRLLEEYIKEQRAREIQHKQVMMYNPTYAS